MKRKKGNLIAVIMSAVLLTVSMGGNPVFALGENGKIISQTETEARETGEEPGAEEPGTEAAKEPEAEEPDTEAAKEPEAEEPDTEAAKEPGTGITEELKTENRTEEEVLKADYSWYEKETGDIYSIYDEKQFKAFADIVNGRNGMKADDFYGKTIIMKEDIDLSVIDLEFWEPIGCTAAENEKTIRRVFEGTFEGNGRLIKGAYFGLFGTIGKHALVRKVAVMGETKEGDAETSYNGGIAGVLYGRVENCIYLGNSESENVFGGIAGTISEGASIENCLVLGIGSSLIGVKASDDVSLSHNVVFGEISGEGDGFTIKTKEELVSGEAAWLLSDFSKEETIFGQKLGTDTYPLFYNPVPEEFAENQAATEFPVYRLSFYDTDGTAIEDVYASQYTNDVSSVPVPEQGYVWKDAKGVERAAGSISLESDLELYKVPCSAEKDSSGKLQDIVPAVSEYETNKPKIAEKNKSIAQIHGIYIEPIEKYTYDGKAKKPAITVYDTGVLLKAGKDYTAKYKNNTKAGKAVVMITGKGNYNSMITTEFEILPKNIEDEDMTVVFSNTYAEGKKKQMPAPQIKQGKHTLKKNIDYKISYRAMESPENRLLSVDKAGSYCMEVEGTGNYEGILELPFEIVSTAEKTLMKKSAVSLNKKSMPYTGRPIVADGSNFILTVKNKGRLLVENKDYAVSYINNVKVGTATVKVSAVSGSAFSGAKNVTFQIKGTPIQKAVLEGFQKVLPYTGKEVKQSLVLKYGEEVLKEGKDYEISYLKNIAAGKATVLIAGKNGYTGVMKKTYTIEQITLSESMLIKHEETKEFCQAGAKAGVTLMFNNGRLVEGRDYTLKYKNNKSLSSESKKALISITGKGNFKGTLKEIRTFEIVPKAFSSDEITVKQEDLVYRKNKPDTFLYKPKVTVYDNGVKVPAKQYQIEYEGNSQKEVNEAVEGGTKAAPITVTIRSTVGGNYTGEHTGGIAYVSVYTISKAVCEPITKKTYRGVPLELEEADFRNDQGKSKVTLKVGSGKKELIFGEDFYIASYQKSIFRGTAKAVLKGTGKFCGGTKTVSFKIDPKNMKAYGKTTVRYVDENFRDIVKPEVNEKAEIGESYTFQPKDFDGYKKIDTEAVTVTIGKGGDIQEVVFRLERIVVLGDLLVRYVMKGNKELELQPSKKIENLNVEEEHQINAEKIEGYVLEGDYVRTVHFEKGETEKTVLFEYMQASDSQVYMIELEKFGISNDGSNAKETTEGINAGIRYGLERGYHRIKLPEGYYMIDSAVINSYTITDKEGKTWTHNRPGISLESDMEFDITGCTLKQLPSKIAYTAVFTISGCKNTKLIGGTIIGDKTDHYYGTRINESGNDLESGSFDTETGEQIADETKMRTKDFITGFVNQDGSVKELPEVFFLMPLWNSTMNTVDGGLRYIFCYDENNRFLGMSKGGNGFVKQAALQPGTKKIKVSFKNETNKNAAFYITEEDIYPTYEFGAGITVGNSNGVEIIGCEIKDTTGDCILTYPIPLEVSVDNLSIIDCVLSGSRRQGISFVSNGENSLVKGTTIKDINGIDPQCGIDFEHYGYCRDTIIDDCTFYNNKKLDIVNYNGTEIEIKNSRFSGLVGTTFGHSMKVHDNIFEYTQGQMKIHKAAGVQLTTKNNVVWNNKFINADINVVGEASEAYGNYITGGLVRIKNTYRNIYENVKEVYIERTDSFRLFEGSEFINCEVFVSSDKEREFPLTIRNCKFTNSKFNGRGVTNIEMCEFNNDTRLLTDGFATAGSESNYYKCSINMPKTAMLQGGNRVINFRDCNIWVKRTENMQYGSTSFDNTTIKFETGDSDRSKTITFNKGGYGYGESPWFFRNCIFEAADAMAVYSNNGHETNTASGPVELR